MEEYFKVNFIGWFSNKYWLWTSPYSKSPFESFIYSLIFTRLMPTGHAHFSGFILFKSKQVAFILSPVLLLFHRFFNGANRTPCTQHWNLRFTKDLVSTSKLLDSKITSLFYLGLSFKQSKL